MTADLLLLRYKTTKNGKLLYGQVRSVIVVILFSSPPSLYSLAMSCIVSVSLSAKRSSLPMDHELDVVF